MSECKSNLTIEWLDEASSPDVAELPVDTLASLRDEVIASAKLAARRLAVLDQGIGVKYFEQEAFIRNSKKFGIVSLDDGEFTVALDAPKTVKWDQAKLAEIEKTIVNDWAEPPEQYITIDRKVSEDAYKNWPDTIKKLFEPARTTKPGKTKIDIRRRKKESA